MPSFVRAAVLASLASAAAGEAAANGAAQRSSHAKPSKVTVPSPLHANNFKNMASLSTAVSGEVWMSQKTESALVAHLNLKHLPSECNGSPTDTNACTVAVNDGTECAGGKMGKKVMSIKTKYETATLKEQVHLSKKLSTVKGKLVVVWHATAIVACAKVAEVANKGQALYAKMAGLDKKPASGMVWVESAPAAKASERYYNLKADLKGLESCQDTESNGECSMFVSKAKSCNASTADLNTQLTTLWGKDRYYTTGLIGKKTSKTGTRGYALNKKVSQIRDHVVVVTGPSNTNPVACGKLFNVITTVVSGASSVGAGVASLLMLAGAASTASM